MPTQRESTTVVGHRFEERVATLLRLFGYNVEWNVHLNGNQIDVYATVELPTHTDTILVECKDYAKTIGVDKVREFFAVVAQQTPDVRGLFISENGFTPEAKEFAENSRRLSVYRCRDLERKVIDPAQYFKSKIKFYPETGVAATYVDLPRRVYDLRRGLVPASSLRGLGKRGGICNTTSSKEELLSA